MISARFRAALACLLLFSLSCLPETPGEVPVPPEGTGAFVVQPTGGDDTATLVSAVQNHDSVVVSQPLKIDRVAAFGAVQNKTITFTGEGKLVRSVRPNTVTFQVMLFTGSKNIRLINPQIQGPGQVCNVISQGSLLRVGHYGEVESQHGISLEGVDQFVIEGGYVHDVGGDGLYISRNNATEAPSTNVEVNGLHTKCTGRNSISNIHSQFVTVNGGTFELSGLWIINIEPFNTLRVADYNVIRPVIGYSNFRWLYVSGPDFSCKVERVTITQPNLAAANTMPPAIAGCVAGQVKIL